MTYVVKFERVGRKHGVPDLLVESDDPDAIAEAVFFEAKKYLGSSWFEVGVYLEKKRGWIEAGRFGRFTLEGPLDA